MYEVSLFEHVVDDIQRSGIIRSGATHKLVRIYESRSLTRSERLAFYTQ
jgi:hypothetical protein